MILDNFGFKVMILLDFPFEVKIFAISSDIQF